MAVAGWRGANAADLLSAEWFNLSASGAEEALYNSRAIRGWSGVGALPTAVPLTAGPKVRIQLPPAESQVRTCLSREFAFLRREAAVSAGVRAGASGAVGRDVAGRGYIVPTGGNIS